MSMEEFDLRTRSNMEVALERACESLPSDQSGAHTAREFVARSILDAAHRGDITLTKLTEICLQAASELSKVH
jgi:hypothetical protein